MRCTRELRVGTDAAGVGFGWGNARVRDIATAVIRVAGRTTRILVEIHNRVDYAAARHTTHITGEVARNRAVVERAGISPVNTVPRERAVVERAPIRPAAVGCRVAAEDDVAGADR